MLWGWSSLTSVNVQSSAEGKVHFQIIVPLFQSLLKVNIMASSPLRFDGKVVLVTGAGNGLGKAYALDFAARGASVVVNDLGGNISGTGSGSRAADKVVEEIQSKGGKAVANYDSVEFGENLVKTALENFGRIDIIVNNAGILRDRSFVRIKDEDWDIIQRVHLRGTFLVSRAAWPHMKKQGYGRIIMVTSAAGIYGNFGQANYSAAKLGIVGLANTLSIEGRKNNIFVNTVAPIAGSRLTETVMTKEMVDALKPEYVSPLVIYLSHDTCKETGGLFEVGAGYFAKLRWQRTEGVILREPNKILDAEKVRDNWNKITDFNKVTYPRSSQESMGMIMQLNSEIDAAENAAVEAARTKDPVAMAKAYKTSDVEFNYTERDAIIYALGVGVSTKQPGHLKFLFELSDEFSVIPSFGVIPAFACLVKSSGNIPGIEIDPTKILHGEQYLELYKPLPRSGKLTSTFKVADVMDKKSGAVLLYNIETFDEKGEKVAFNQFSTFVVGAGNFGGPKKSNEITPLASPPSRNPDAVMEEKTSVDQAALYRLSGDSNPLHIDPMFAAMGGFKTPILHGLCTFGHSVRHVMATYADNDMSRFKAVKVRFVKPVLPGQSLRTEMWRDGNRVFFKTKVVETGDIVISGAYLDLHAYSPVKAQPTSGLKSTAIFKTLADQAKNTPEMAKSTKATYQWNIQQEGKTAATWTMDLKANEIYEGTPRSGKAECILSLSDDTFLGLVNGTLDAQKAFLSGKLKIQGDIMLAQKLGNILPSAKM
ncbi:peroxisomal multifunctional enzyme type 2 [Plakobranchus ocellatus]|uniref:Peroxisomal multifunctional enzyme type 2 n=1 Tax=Plakobranchus ocellatus TaxID=259542 RepID=A0AAV3YIZ9_9GAST|nr:peroxisomal multifunctional enzyme type 2 [Plakobranchus ocellatus]